MCTQSCLDFVTGNLTSAEATGRSVLEVGALDVNGSVRPFLQSLAPSSYVGVDIQAGPGVDVVCRGEDLLTHFGVESFDIVVTTEMLEHARDWRSVVHNLKGAVRSNGLLLATTRSKGFPFHAYPFDFWRYELQDMREIFADMDIIALEPDPLSPGVFVKARKPSMFSEVPLDGVALYSMILRRRAKALSEGQIDRFCLAHKVLAPLKALERMARHFRNRALGRRPGT